MSKETVSPITVRVHKEMDAWQNRSNQYSMGATGIGRNELVHGEGPIVVRGPGPGSWFLFIDEFGLRRYTAFTSDSLDAPTWTGLSAKLPPGASHGSILALSEEQWARLDALADG